MAGLHVNRLKPLDPNLSETISSFIIQNFSLKRFPSLQKKKSFVKLCSRQQFNKKKNGYLLMLPFQIVVSKIAKHKNSVHFSRFPWIRMNLHRLISTVYLLSTLNYNPNLVIISPWPVMLCTERQEINNMACMTVIHITTITQCQEIGFLCFRNRSDFL